MRALPELARLLRSSRYSHQELADGSGVVLDLTGMRVWSLNRTGMAVFGSIVAGVDRREDLIDRLTAAFDVDAPTAAADLDRLLDQLDRLLDSAARS